MTNNSLFKWRRKTLSTELLGLGPGCSYFIYTPISRALGVNTIVRNITLNILSQYCLFLLGYNRHCKWLEFKNDLCIFLKNRSNWLGWQDSNLRMLESKSSALPLGYTPIFEFSFNLCIAPALSDSNGLLYVTKRYNSHSVSSLGQRLELFFNKLFSYFPLYFHLNFARGTVTI